MEEYRSYRMKVKLSDVYLNKKLGEVVKQKKSVKFGKRAGKAGVKATPKKTK